MNTANDTLVTPVTHDTPVDTHGYSHVPWSQASASVGQGTTDHRAHCATGVIAGIYSLRWGMSPGQAQEALGGRILPPCCSK